VVVLPPVSKIEYDMRGVLVKVALFKCSRGKDYHHAKPYISVIVECQSLQKLHVHLYVHFAEQQQVHGLTCHASAAYVLHLLLGKNPFLSNFCVHCKSHFSVKPYDLESASVISLQWPHHYHYNMCEQNT
jgi:hypothetical protein